MDWIAKRYWHRLGWRRRSFAVRTGVGTPHGKSVLARLVDPTETTIRRHVKVKADANPFDLCGRTYFGDRAVFKQTGIHR